MKIYIASRYQRRLEMVQRAGEILERYPKHQICSRWVAGGEVGLSQRQAAEMDKQDIESCDLLICFTLPLGTMHSGGGHHWELGYATGLGKDCWIVGEKSQVFHHLPFPELIHFPEWHDALRELA